MDGWWKANGAGHLAGLAAVDLLSMKVRQHSAGQGACLISTLQAIPLPISTQGNKSFLDDKNDKYGYAPIANGLAILEENNAIPVVRGGWVEEPVEKTARETLKIDSPQGEQPLPEKAVTKIFRWVINKGKLKTALIRPLTRWSSKELDSAIKSKVIEELLDIPLKMIDLITLILVVAIIGATVYYGAQNTQLLQAILAEVTVDPYIPLP